MVHNDLKSRNSSVSTSSRLWRGRL